MMKLLEKYMSYDKEGTRPPPQVKEETKLYKTSSDIFANWFDDYIEETDEFASFEELYDGWEEHCNDIRIDKRNRLAKTDLKNELLKEQEKTEYGLVLGRKIAEGAANGTKKKPRFNFRIMED